MEVEVKIKRYMAASMRAALGQVRAEQGPDAVILSSRRVAEGIEVIAAVDYDEALFADATRLRAPAKPPATPAEAPLPAPAAAPAAAAEPAPRPPLHAPAPAAAPIQAAVCAPAAPAPVRAALRSDSGSGSFSAMQRELKDLRDLLESGFATMGWNDRRLREPLKARVLEELSVLDIAPDVAMALATHTPRRTSLDNPSLIPFALLVKYLPVVDRLSTVNGGIIAVVGPTGAGKTTTIAKLAARWSMQHGSQDLALVSTDGYRIGARDQLMTYARALPGNARRARRKRQTGDACCRSHPC